ncbi:hypothetical protein FACS1894161_0580 [Spirochaetia bacterium]|nr:hypothetical protein FACS1894161_0580 [Spirochaetia bacterium]
MNKNRNPSKWDGQLHLLAERAKKLFWALFIAICLVPALTLGCSDDDDDDEYYDSGYSAEDDGEYLASGPEVPYEPFESGWGEEVDNLVKLLWDDYQVRVNLNDCSQQAIKDNPLGGVITTQSLTEKTTWHVDHKYYGGKFAVNVLSFAYEALENTPPGLVKILTTIRPLVLLPDTTAGAGTGARFSFDDWTIRLYDAANPYTVIYEIGHGITSIITNYRENFYEDWIALNRGRPLWFLFGFFW